MSDGLVKGSCLCGNVGFKIEGAMRPVIACHCVPCRKTSGHFVAATSVARNEIEIEGEVSWYVSSDTARRGFCGVCGASLFWDGAGENLSVMAGTLDRPTGSQIAGHIYCADKGDYYDVPDDISISEQDDPILTTMVMT